MNCNHNLVLNESKSLVMTMRTTNMDEIHAEPRRKRSKKAIFSDIKILLVLNVIYFFLFVVALIY